MAKRGRARKAPKTTYDKVKEFDADFAATVMVASEEDMKARLLDIAAYDERLAAAKSADPEIASLSNQLKTANQTYKVPLSQNKLKRRLILETLKDRGRLDLDAEFKTPES